MYAACRGSRTQSRLRDSVYVPDNRTGRDPFAALTAAAAPRQSSFVCATFSPRASSRMTRYPASTADRPDDGWIPRTSQAISSAWAGIADIM